MSETRPDAVDFESDDAEWQKVVDDSRNRTGIEITDDMRHEYSEALESVARYYCPSKGGQDLLNEMFEQGIVTSEKSAMSWAAQEIVDRGGVRLDAYIADCLVNGDSPAFVSYYEMWRDGDAAPGVSVYPIPDDWTPKA